jgi:phage recombination protein Bet
MAQIVRQEVVNPIQIKDTQGNVTATYDEDMVAAVKNTVAREATDAELFMFLNVCNKYDLDPFLGEIYFVKTKEGKSSLMSGRDGYRKIAMREPTYKVHYSDAVFENDTFKVIRKMGKLEDIIHEYEHQNRGSLVGAYSILQTTDGRTYFFYAEMKYYNTNQNAWQTYPKDMIIKVAETRVFKSFANINGIQAEESMPSEYSSEENVKLPEKEEVEFIETKTIEEE